MEWASEYEAKRYEGRVKNGGTLLSVYCDGSDEISRAKELLEEDIVHERKRFGFKARGGTAVLQARLSLIRNDHEKK